MTLSSLIHKQRRDEVATATPANIATSLGETAGTLAGIAGVAVANLVRNVTARAWLLHFADRNPLEVWFAPPATHEEVLASYSDAVAAVPIPERCVVLDLPQTARQSAQQSAQQSATQSAHQSASQSARCSTCRHRARPGLADPGYCSMRTDQPKAYGLHHPLHKLPADGGADCGSYAAHE